mgnify:CR=1 FL=1
MKITRKSLTQLIAEELHTNTSMILLEEIPQEEDPQTIVGQEQTGDYTKGPEEYGDELARRSLFHMGTQAQQLHDMIQEDSGLEPWILDEIEKAARGLEKAFKAVTYEKQHPEGR